MKKALIYTLYGNINYGNKLQNIAVQKLFEKYNIETYTVVNESKNNIINQCKKIIKNYLPKYRNKLMREQKRLSYFKSFDNNISKIGSRKINVNDYDYIIVGSDQVWNPNDELSQKLVSEVNKIENKKIISIAASIAIDKIAEKDIEKYKKHFEKVNNISVREEKGRELIKELTKRNDVEVLLDPTMLIEEKIWNTFEKEPEAFKKFNIKKNKYILTYFLGEQTEKRRKEIERIANEKECKIINLMDISDDFYINGPSEFLFLEKNAFLICTDSFHSAVFALLYNKPFIIYEREQNGIESMNSRIDTLISKFKLQNRKYNGEKITENNLKHDYSEAQKILKEERKKCDAFIKNALK